MEGKTPATARRRLSRRDFLKLFMMAGMVGLDTLLMVQIGKLYSNKIEPFLMDVNEVRLKLPRLPKSFSGFRVAQISDFHLGGWMKVPRMSAILKRVMDLSPDLVALTGDFVMAYGFGRNVPAKMKEITPALSELAKKAPVMGVLGNHDHMYGAASVVDMLEQAGITHLGNAVSQLRRGTETLSIAGVDAMTMGKANLGQVLSQLPGDGCAILLAHEPDFADESAATGRFDLQISGHSHGGQVVLPFIGPPVLPRLGEKYPQGLYRVGDMLQYTNRGVGVTMPYLRFNCPPEITVFTLESA